MSSLPPAWADVVDRINTALATALAAADQQDRALDAVAAADPSDAFAADILARLRQRLDALDASCRRAERLAAEAEEALTPVAHELTEWQARVSAVRRSLAEPPRGAV